MVINCVVYIDVDGVESNEVVVYVVNVIGL